MIKTAIITIAYNAKESTNVEILYEDSDFFSWLNENKSIVTTEYFNKQFNSHEVEKDEFFEAFILQKAKNLMKSYIFSKKL